MARKPAAPSADAESNAAKPERVIKKYPNRRLYDTATSSYVTLTEIKQLVMQGETFVVRDAKSGEDLTRSLLLQIILEEESSGAPMFTEAVLANIIRFYGHAMQGHMGAYLESNLQSLMLMQSKMGHQSQNIMRQMQEQMQKQTAQFLSAFGLKP
jgi:polyhydroxyalkanoate synthesis repressor PhaR